MSKFMCFLGLHNWSKFGEIVKAYGGLTQFRKCEDCNAIDYRGCYANQANPIDVNRTTNQQGKDNDQANYKI